MSLYGLGLRASFKISDTIRDRGLQAPKDIVRFDNLPYGTDPRWQTLDVYRPKNAGGTALPVIVSVHGGGWVYGDKNLYQYYCMSLAQHGFAVVNFSYRLAPRHKFPAALQDTDAVFHWVMAHAVDYHFDTRHVFAVGDSAGANILGLYAARCADPAAANIPVTPPPGFVPTALALNCGAPCGNAGGQQRLEGAGVGDGIHHFQIDAGVALNGQKVTGHVQAGQSFGDHLPGAAAQNTKGTAGAAQCGNHLGDIDAFTARIGADGSNAVYAVRGKGRNFNGFIQCRVQGDSIDHENEPPYGEKCQNKGSGKGDR